MYISGIRFVVGGRCILLVFGHPNAVHKALCSAKLVSCSLVLQHVLCHSDPAIRTH
jgi:hypothetical protein